MQMNQATTTIATECARNNRRSAMRQGYLSIRFLTILAFFTFSATALAGVNEVWDYRWDGASSRDDSPFAMAVDDSGYIYLTGSTIGELHPDYATLKLDPTGNLVWQAFYGGPAVPLGIGPDSICISCDMPSDIFVDDSGNVYVTGATDPNELNDDFATLKYDRDGNEIWAVLYAYKDSLSDVPNALTIDALGNIFVAGHVSDADAFKNCCLIKYLPNGDTAWVRLYDGPAGLDDNLADVAVDAAGDIYAVGSVWGLGTFRDAAAFKYDTDGNMLWLQSYDGTAGELDELERLVIDDNGNVYAVGNSYGADTGQDILLVKYDSDGGEVWHRTLNGTANSHDKAKALQIDMDGNIFVTGGIDNGNNSDFALAKYTPDGDTLWLRTYDGAGNFNDVGRDLAIDALNNIYVTGQSNSAEGDFDYLTVAYNSDGELLWAKTYDGPSDGADQSYLIEVTGDNEVVVAGESNGGVSHLDYFVVRYSYTPPVCGDADGSAVVNISDGVFLVNFIFGGGPAPETTLEGDPDCNNMVNISDAVYLVQYIFGGGPAPCANCL
jgi:uncharacterized delta-60 repeat protein